jgi:hypothetical protein
MGLILISVYLTAFVKAHLLQPLPDAFTNVTNTVWIGANEFILPWQFTRTSTGYSTCLFPDN